MGSTSLAAVFGINLLMSLPFFMYFIRVPREMTFRGLMLVGLAATLYCLLLTNTRSAILVRRPDSGLLHAPGANPRSGEIILAGMAGAVRVLACGVVVARAAGPKEFALYSTALALALG
jgi:hypothetical protein